MSDPLFFDSAAVRPGVVANVRVASGVVVEVGPRVAPQPTDRLIRADGRALLPGLVDHHTHLMAAAADAVDCSDVVTPAALVARLAGRGAGWVRATGYDVTASGPIDRTLLDRVSAPVRVQDRTGALWVLNSAALDVVLAAPGPWPDGVEVDGAGAPTGRLWRLDGWLRGRVPTNPPDLAGLGASLAGRGITALTDATHTNGAGEVRLLAAARLPQRLTVMTADPWVVAAAGTTLGPVKVMLDDATLPDLTALTARVAAAHGAGRPVAVHCVTAAQLVLTLAALDDAGHLAGDRIEHAAVVPASLVPTLAASGVTVVTQPGLVWKRGDRYLSESPGDELADLYRVATLQAAGVTVVGSTDAPFGDPDPWVGVATAVSRMTSGGAVVAGAEAVDVETAVGLFAGPPIAAGTVADLCLVDESWSGLRAGRGAELRVALTLVAGRIVHGAVPER